MSIGSFVAKHLTSSTKSHQNRNDPDAAKFDKSPYKLQTHKSQKDIQIYQEPQIIVGNNK